MKTRGPTTADPVHGQIPQTSHTARLAEQFAEELANLSEAGNALRHSHPNLARYLHREAQDPDVERLIEATAFLCSQISARVGACAPELTSELVDRVAPWMNRDMPSLCIAAVDVPVSSDITVVALQKGTVLAAHGQHVGAQWRTTAQINLWPMQVFRPQISTHSGGAIKLIFKLKTCGRILQETVRDLGLSFYIDGPAPKAHALAMALWHGSFNAELWDGLSFDALPGKMARDLSQAAEPLTPTFTEDPPLTRGIAAVRDVFGFPQKFLFVRFTLDEAESGKMLAEETTLSVSLDPQFGDVQDFAGVSLRINCVPVHNLTAADAIPMRLQPGVSKYVLRPEPQQSNTQLCVLGTQSVTLTQALGCNQTNLYPLHSHRYDYPGDVHGPHYTLQLPASMPVTQRLAKLCIHDVNGEPYGLHGGTVSARLLCHNGAHMEHVPSGELNMRALHPRAFVATNISATTAVVPPLAHAQRRQSLLALMMQRSRCNFSVEDLTGVLPLILQGHHKDSAVSRNQTQLIDSIQSVQSAQSVRLWRGAQVICLDIFLQLNTAMLHSLGQAYVFADCLNHFFADHLPLHGIMRLQLRLEGWGRTITWPLQCGEQSHGITSCTSGEEHR